MKNLKYYLTKIKKNINFKKIKNYVTINGSFTD